MTKADWIPQVGSALCVALFASCAAPAARLGPAEVAESLLDAFYAWDAEGVARRVASGPAADRLLYYQAWAQAAHYAVQTRRPCELASTDRFICAVTVTDDFGSALGYVATDTFIITVEGERASNVEFEGNDPPVFEELFAWIAQQRPEVLAGPCHEMFAGGTTPAECSRAVAEAARAFASLRK